METAKVNGTDEWIKKMWYLYTMEVYSAMKKMKSYYSHINGWNWRPSSGARLARLRRPKIVCSPSNVDFRFRANTAILFDLGHILSGVHIPEVWGLVGNPKHESV
jgi:hypothetical protein